MAARVATDMRVLRGAAASAGVARGPWIVVRPAAAPAGGRIEPHQIDPEIARFGLAAAASAEELESLAERMAADGHAEEGEIFSAQAAMALDPALESAAADRIRSGEDAIAAVQGAAAELADQLRAIEDELLAARAADVLDVGARIANHLAGRGGDTGPGLDRPSIIAAEDLAPSTTATLQRDRLLGLVLEGGSPTAHAAILARAYGIPAVVGVSGLLAALEAAVAAGGGREVAIDGEAGEVVIDPDAATVERYGRRLEEVGQAASRDLAEATLSAITQDGVEVTLLANIGTPAESARCVALGAHGVGLFRTEFLFMERDTAPSEDEQIAAYRAVLEAFAPHSVTIRLLDIGGDKPVPYLPIPPEANPFLGVRALRLATDRPELFVRQLRATMRAAATPGVGSVKVMAPMVADARDADLLLALADQAHSELDAEGAEHGEIRLGVMLEIPSAVLVANSYFDRLRFASLGTNDLLQYTLAVDRGNRELARYQDSLHPALLRLIRDAVAAAENAGIELSVCGEMAGDPIAALALVGLGIRQLSMASSSLASVRRSVRAASLSTLERETELALGDSSAEAVRKRIRQLIQD